MLDDLSNRLSERLKELRQGRGWSLDELAAHSGLSRATLSRMEKGEVSPTAESLGRLCQAHGLPMSRLMMMVEDTFVPRVPVERQTEWTDPETGYVRRSVSPSLWLGPCCAGKPPLMDAPPAPGAGRHT